MSKYLTLGRDDTVAFVYKDGPFPGGDDSGGVGDPFRIVEANDQKGARSAGRTLAGLHQSGKSGLDHNLIASGRVDNEGVLVDIEREVFQK